MAAVYYNVELSALLGVYIGFYRLRVESQTT